MNPEKGNRIQIPVGKQKYDDLLRIQTSDPDHRHRQSKCFGSQFFETVQCFNKVIVLKGVGDFQQIHFADGGINLLDSGNPEKCQCVRGIKFCT